ncbi:YraN family protein [Acidovorax radicis]|jgi:putative endonuclease|uniref:YraN family protein n=1 Tax=Acidovorax radicis TaxID=758826 RepID=UPI001CFAF1A2|nr:YraN family protein [Acidovorax radicis]UCU99632.1 YraN family protein [Acidovorax radicis]
MKFLGKRKPEMAAPQALASPGPAATRKVTTRQRGNAAEDKALAFLQAAGLQLVERNYRTPGRGGGEIDLVMRDRGGTLVFVEVRSRASSAFGGAGASISAVKQQRIVFAARHYLLRMPSPPPCRFDVVLVEESVEWLQAAFDAQ